MEDDSIIYQEAPIEEDDLYDKLMDLTVKNTELENLIYMYKSKLESKDKLLEMYFEDTTSKTQPKVISQPQPQPQSRQIKTSEKLEYFYTHKNDKDILEKLVPFKMAYPDIQVPRTLIKHFTDNKYEVESKLKK